MQNGLVVKHLGYRCDTGRWLFKDLSFDVERGSLLHVVGANGVGKTTLLRVIVGLLRCEDWSDRQQEGGTIVWPGAPDHLFYLDHAIAVKSALTVWENIVYDYHLLGVDPLPAHAALERVGLWPQRHQLAGFLSRGQKQRIVFGKLLCSKAILYVLDEPFTAMDAAGIKLAEHILDEKLQQQSIIVMTRHDTFGLAALQSKVRMLCLES